MIALECVYDNFPFNQQYLSYLFVKARAAPANGFDKKYYHNVVAITVWNKWQILLKRINGCCCGGWRWWLWCMISTIYFIFCNTKLAILKIILKPPLKVLRVYQIYCYSSKAEYNRFNIHIRTTYWDYPMHHHNNS